MDGLFSYRVGEKKGTGMNGVKLRSFRLQTNELPTMPENHVLRGKSVAGTAVAFGTRFPLKFIPKPPYLNAIRDRQNSRFK
jgi:hypothetical protein